MKNKNIFIRIIGSIWIPLITFLTLLIICQLNDVKFFDSNNSYITFFRATATVMLTTYALSINLNSGRFDFSIGSVALFSSVISSSIAIQYEWGPLAMVFLSVLFGLLLGTISGIIYVLVKLPPIIVSLGITLLYEGASFAYTNGYGVSFVTDRELTSVPGVLNYLIIILLALTCIICIFDFSKFGFDYKALISGQKVAVNTGINEKLNAVICYMIAGGLMGLVGFITSTNTGTIQMSLNFSSIAIMFTAFLPMFIGGFISRFCNEKLGYVLGAVTTAFISVAYARLNVTSSVQQVVTALILVLFLIYLNNEGLIKKIFSIKKFQKETL